MNARLAMQVLQAGRIAIGAALVAVPARPGGDWVGEDGRTPGGQVAMRALGAREILVGAGAFHAARGGDAKTAATWALAIAACDLVDAAATGVAAGSLPHRGVPVGALALGSAAAGALIAARLCD